MYQIGNSPYLFHDHILTDLARIYSNENHEPYFIAIGNHDGFDMKSLSNIKYELKYETTPIRTKNVAIEIFNTDLKKPSGINATQAIVWMHLVLEEDGLHLYEYSVEKLKAIIQTIGISKHCGRNSICRIIPLVEFRKHAERSFKLDLPFLNALNQSKPQNQILTPCTVIKNSAASTDAALIPNKVENQLQEGESK